MKDKPVVLVVDDQPQNIELLEAYLAPQSYEVVQAANGEEALEKLSGGQIDLVLLDVMMPKMDGFEVLKKMRADKKTRLIPVVMVTALQEVEDRVKALEAGCDDFLSKPFDKAELLSRVKSILKLGYYRRQLDEKEKFESVLNQMDEGLVVLDDKFGVIAHNPHAFELLEIEPAKIPADLLTALAGRFKIHCQGELAAALGSGNLSFELEREATEKFKELILEVRSSVVRPPEGEGQSIVLTLRDVTAKRSLDRMEWSFIDVISHKLRSPLTGIIGQGAVLRAGYKGKLTAEQQAAIEIVYDQSLKLSGLIDKILKFNQLTAEPLGLPKEELALARVMGELAGAAAKEINGKKIELKIESENISLRMHKRYFELILNNLIENAIKFNDRDPVKIDISAKKTPAGITLSIKDNGRGIPPEELENIFKGFFQVERYFTGSVEGLGLGLALVKRIVGDHGGKISVKSAIGQGTEFIIELPA